MIDWAASVLDLTKMVLVAKRKRVGFVVGFMSCVAWLAYVLISKSAYGLLLVLAPAMIINVYGYIHWGRIDAGKEGK